MSDNPELRESPEFRAWVETLPDAHWAKHDLSACRLGWEAGRAAQLVASAAPADREGVLSEAIEAARRIGNFRDLRRDELTADFGQPRFDMMNRIIEAIEELKSTPAPGPGAAPLDNAELVGRLRHASTTASNDDLSKPGTEKRQRHADRVAVMLEAAAALDAQAALLREAADVMRGVLNSRLKSDFDRARSLLLKLTEATKP